MSIRCTWLRKVQSSPLHPSQPLLSKGLGSKGMLTSIQEVAGIDARLDGASTQKSTQDGTAGDYSWAFKCFLQHRGAADKGSAKMQSVFRIARPKIEHFVRLPQFVHAGQALAKEPALRRETFSSGEGPSENVEGDTPRSRRPLSHKKTISVSAVAKQTETSMCNVGCSASESAAPSRAKATVSNAGSSSEAWKRVMHSPAQLAVKSQRYTAGAKAELDSNVATYSAIAPRSTARWPAQLSEIIGIVAEAVLDTRSSESPDTHAQTPCGKTVSPANAGSCHGPLSSATLLGGAAKPLTPSPVPKLRRIWSKTCESEPGKAFKLESELAARGHLTSTNGSARNRSVSPSEGSAPGLTELADDELWQHVWDAVLHSNCDA